MLKLMLKNRRLESPRRNAVCILLALLAVLSVAPALAVDGVTELNDARAVAGGVTPGDTAGYPVTISQSGSYRLTGDLSPPGSGTTGIVISADFVTLDLNGFAIRGGITCTGSGAGVSCSPAGSSVGIDIDSSFVTVRNGLVTGMNTGIRGLSTTAGIEVRGVRAVGNGSWGMDLNTLGVSVRETLCARNGAGGMWLQDAALVIDNVVAENDGRAIIIYFGSLARNNVSRLNDGEGLTVWGAGVNVLGNTLTDNNLELSFTQAGGYADNVIETGAGSTVSGGTQIGTNYCDGNTTCP